MVWRSDRLQSYWLTITAALSYCPSVVKWEKEVCCKFGHNAALSKYWLQFNSPYVISSYILQLVHFQLLINAQLFSVGALHRTNNSRSDNVATFLSQYSINFKILLVLHKQQHLELLVGEKSQTVNWRQRQARILFCFVVYQPGVSSRPKIRPSFNTMQCFSVIIL